MKDNSEDRRKDKRERLQLRRLEVVMDVVYGILIWRIFFLLPKPDHPIWAWQSMSRFFSAHVLDFLLAIIALVIVIVYWLQNNLLFGSLKRTDSKHTVLAILQIFFLLLFLYSIKLGLALGASSATRAIESITAALVGIASIWAWSYAIKDGRLLAPEVSQEEALQIKERILVEPATAIITLPLAFVGPILWELAWFLYPLIAYLVKRHRRALQRGVG